MSIVGFSGMIKKVLTAIGGLALFINVGSAEVILASTTSTQHSGLYEYLIPLIEKDIGEEIHVVAVGTGQALKLGENGDADLLIVHAPEKERRFVREGYGIDRRPFMYNTFVLVGPQNDPAGIQRAANVATAMAKLAKSGNAGNIEFISRGDNSGTHFKEQALWQSADLIPQGTWYRESGSGMGATLNIAAASDAYTLSDSSTWLKFANKQHLQSLYTNPTLFNQYSVILIPKDRHPHVQSKYAKAIADWLVSEKGQNAINAYRINGQQAFTANAQISDKN